MKRNVKMTCMISVLVLLLFVPVINAQTNTDEVRLFESFFFDVPISEKPYVQGGLEYASLNDGSILDIGAQGGYALNEKMEIQAGWGFRNLSPEVGDSQSGISDLALYGRYKLVNSGPTNFAAGAMITLPIGSEDVGQGTMDFGGFGAVRHSLDNGMTLTGRIALIFYEVGDDRETSFNLGAGTIYPINEKLSSVSEFSLHSEGEYMILTSGIDYNMGSGRVRAGLGIGLDDGAPDIKIMGGYLLTL